jgi:beta-lactamase superfamily II metal-dependent hydrolase
MRKLFCISLIVFSIFICNSAYAAEGELRARVIDCAVGLCVAIRLPNDHFIVYDTGKNSDGYMQLKAYLGTNPQIDLLVLSHNDQDHIGYADDLLKEFDVARVLHSGFVRITDELEPMDAWFDYTHALWNEVRLHGCEEINLRCSDIDFGSEIETSDEDVTVTFVCGWAYPPNDWGFSLESDESEYKNAGSIVIKVEYEGSSILLTGDTEEYVGTRDDAGRYCRAAEAFMIDNCDVDSDVLIGQHHGSDGSSSPELIDAIDPDYVIFSAGGSFRHPRLSTYLRFQSYFEDERGLDIGFDGVDQDGVRRVFKTDVGDSHRAGEWYLDPWNGGIFEDFYHIDITIFDDGTPMAVQYAFVEKT